MKARLNYLLFLTVALGALTLNTALADDAADQTNNGGIAVSYEDLNLANSTGLATLYRRVESAAEKVCNVDHLRVTLNVMRKQKDCVAWSIDKAIGHIGDARLTAFHTSKLAEINRS